MPYCSDCGAENNKYAQYCIECGELNNFYSDGEQNKNTDKANTESDNGMDTESHDDTESTEGKRNRWGQSVTEQTDNQDSETESQVSNRAGHYESNQGVNSKRQTGQESNQRSQNTRQQRDRQQIQHSGGQRTGQQRHGQRNQRQQRRQGNPPSNSSGAFSFSLNYPQSNGWGAPLLTVGLYFLSSFILFPVIFIYGYTLDVARSAAQGHAFPREYNDWGRLFIDGLRIFALVLLTGVVWLLVLLFGIGLIGASLDQIPAAVFIGLIGWMVSYPWILIPYCMGLVKSRSVIETLTDGQIYKFMISWFYAKAFIMYCLLSVVVGLISLVSIITIIGPILVAGYFILASGAYWGYVYFDAVEKGILDAPIQV